MESTEHLEGVVRSFIVNELLEGSENGELTHTTHLVKGGIVDSINVLRLVDFLEEEYDIEVEPTDIRQFITIENIARIVHQRMSS